MTPLQRAQRVEELAQTVDLTSPWRVSVQDEGDLHGEFTVVCDAPAEEDCDHEEAVILMVGPDGNGDDCEFVAELSTLAPALAADVRQLTAENERLQYAHDNLSRELRRQREALEEYREQANRWMGEAARILLGPDPDPADESLVLPALARKVRGRLEALTDLLRDAFPMFSHVPLLRDRAVALGLVDRKEQDDG